jgi:hypothetical protein
LDLVTVAVRFPGSVGAWLSPGAGVPVGDGVELGDGVEVGDGVGVGPGVAVGVGPGVAAGVGEGVVAGVAVGALPSKETLTTTPPDETLLTLKVIPERGSWRLSPVLRGALHSQ